MAIVRREDKVTQAQLEALQGALVINRAFDGLPELDAIVEITMSGWLGASEIIAGEGKPNVIVRDYESSPGAWIFDDTDTGIAFVVWSDGWKKHPWKGSSIEYVLGDAAEESLPEAFGRLVKRLARSSNHFGFKRAQQLRAFVEDGLGARDALALPLDAPAGRMPRP